MKSDMIGRKIMIFKSMNQEVRKSGKMMIKIGMKGIN